MNAKMMNNILSYEQVLLERHEKDPDELLFKAAVYGIYQDALEALDAGANPDYIAPRSGNSALSEAVKSGNLELVSLMLDRGAYVDLTHDNIGYRMTPLILATDVGDPDMVKLLLDRGANPNAKDIRNRNALSFAVEKTKTKDKHVRVIEILLDAGADPIQSMSPSSFSTYNAIDFARQEKNVRALETIFTRSRSAMLRFDDEDDIDAFFRQMGQEAPRSVLERWRKISRGKNMFGV